MPDCPYCEELLAMCEDGAICVTCKRIYSPATLVTMPGYDSDVIKSQLELFTMLIGTGALQKGKNAVHVLDDGVFIQHLGEQF